jgi:predicted Zn-dependent protease
MKKVNMVKKMIAPLCICAVLVTCTSDPFTGKKSVALVGNSELFPESFAQYQEFLNQSEIIPEGADAEMVQRIGNKIKTAAEQWVDSLGQPDYLKDYQWEYHLVQSDEINAWCMPGGKIVVYTGILPVTQNEDALAVVLGHEVSHALLNHGQQSQSAGIFQQVGAMGVAILTSGMSDTAQQTAQTVYGAGSHVAAILPFSRENENEADHYGLILMTIAGYNPEEAIAFWERMSSLGGGTLEFLSTHPSDEKRIANIQGWIPEAEKIAAELRR